MSKSHKEQSDKIRATIDDYRETKDVLSGGIEMTKQMKQETDVPKEFIQQRDNIIRENEKLQSRLETCGNHLIQAQEVYDALFLDHSALLLEKEQLIADNKRLLREDAIHLSVRKDLEEKIQDDLSTISVLVKSNSILKRALENEKDFRELTVSGLEKYASKLGDQKDSYRRLVWILLCFLLAFGLGFFILLIQRL